MPSVVQHTRPSITPCGLLQDVPGAVNSLLSALPAELQLPGLPFSAVLTYAIYTLSYVLVKGFGEVQVPPLPGSSEGNAPVECPYATPALPVSPGAISSRQQHLTLYLHDSFPNCLLWGLWRAGALHSAAQDGDLPQLRLITDLFGGLMPTLPKEHPKKGVALAMEATSAPHISFRAATAGDNQGPGGELALEASYTTRVSVMGAGVDGADLPVATLAANLSVALALGWESTEVRGVNVSYGVVHNTSAVRVAGWNQIIEWVIKQAAPKQTLSALWASHVAPSPPPGAPPGSHLLSLADVVVGMSGGWVALDTDLQVDVEALLPMLLQARQLGGQALAPS